jgi:hypothetical protein
VRELSKERLSDEGMEYLRANWLNQERTRTQPVIDAAKEVVNHRYIVYTFYDSPIFQRLRDAVAALEDSDG